MALQHEYRPRVLDEFYGSEILKKQVEAWLDRKDANHAVLFTGPSGCGKTTLARICAYTLTSHHSFIELNSADFTGVDTIRKIREQVLYRPLNSNDKFRIWLFDECHKLSTSAQENMLKLLEEAPDGVFFFMATTEPEKLKNTFKRRCTEFKVSPLEVDEIISLLKSVCSSEDVDWIPDKAFKKIARCSDGSPGIALNILDSIIDLDTEDIEESLNSLLFVTDYEVIDLCRGIMKQMEWDAIAEMLKSLQKNKIEPETVRRAVLGYTSKVLLSGKSDAFPVMDAFMEPVYNTGWPGIVYASYVATMRA